MGRVSKDDGDKSGLMVLRRCEALSVDAATRLLTMRVDN
jgi:hypothetical protein